MLEFLRAEIKAWSEKALPDTGVSGTNFEPGFTEWKAVRTSWQFGTCPPSREQSCRKAHRSSARRTEGAAMADSQRLGSSEEEPLQLPCNAFRVSGGGGNCAEEARMRLPFRLGLASFALYRSYLGKNNCRNTPPRGVFGLDLVFFCSAADKLWFHRHLKYWLFADAQMNWPPNVCAPYVVNARSPQLLPVRVVTGFTYCGCRSGAHGALHLKLRIVTQNVTIWHTKCESMNPAWNFYCTATWVEYRKRGTIKNYFSTKELYFNSYIHTLINQDEYRSSVQWQSEVTVYYINSLFF